MWAAGTNRNYESCWRTWTQYCKEVKIPPFYPDRINIANFHSRLTMVDKLSEGRVEAFLSAISATISVVTGQGLSQDLLICKQKYVAAHLNKPKGRKYSEIYDNGYLIQFLLTEVKMSEINSFQEKQYHLILLFRTFLGWRGEDLCGIGIKHGLAKTPEGYRVRFFGSKVNQNKWSNWSDIRYLAQDFRMCCICSWIDEVLSTRESLLYSYEQLKIEEFKVGQASTDFPLFSFLKYPPGGKKNPPTGLKKYSADTINSISCTFLSSITTGPGDDDNLNAQFSGHSFRHSLASYLHDIGVDHLVIADWMQTKVQSLEKSYITQISEEWARPFDCIKWQLSRPKPSIQALVLIPVVHYYWTVARNEGKATSSQCPCARIVPEPMQQPNTPVVPTSSNPSAEGSLRNEAQ